MVMSERTMSASKFKAECLAILDDVAATGDGVLVTKRGRPVARVLPAGEPDGLRGSVTFHVDDDELMAPIDVPWNATGK